MTFSNKFINNWGIKFTRNTLAPVISDATGRTEDGKYELLSIDCCIRSAKGLGSKLRDQGFINEEDQVLYTNTELLPDRGDLKADTFSYKGCHYKVTSVVDNDNTFIDHYKSYASKIEECR